MKINYRINLDRLYKLTFIVILTLTLSNCFNQNDDNDWTKKNLKGNIKSYTEFSYKAEEILGKIKKGKRERLNTIDKQVKFNKSGNIIEENYYNSNGILYSTRCIYTYNNVGNNTEINEYISDGSLVIKMIFKYDKKGNIIESNTYNSDGKTIIGETTYKYDDKGNEIENKAYSINGDLFTKGLTEYYGSTVENYTYGQHGDLYSKITYIIDDDGNNIEWKMENPDGSLNNRITSKYDDGNLIESNHYNSDSSLKTKMIFKYNFDEKGNWIKKIDFDNEIPKYILERKYEYY